MADRETPEYNRNPRFLKLKNNCADNILNIMSLFNYSVQCPNL